MIQGPLKKGTNSSVQQLTILFHSPVLSKASLWGTEILFEPLHTLSVCWICFCTCTLWASKPGQHSPPPWLFVTVLLLFGTGSECQDNVINPATTKQYKQTVYFHVLALGRWICLTAGSHGLPKNRWNTDHSRGELHMAPDYYISSGLNPQKISKGCKYEGSGINMSTLLTILFYLEAITGKWWCY